MAFFPNNTISDQLIPAPVQERFFQEYLGLSPLFDLMGRERTRSVIQVQDLGGTRGRTSQFPLLQSIDYENPSMDFDILEGKEQNLTFLNDTITIRPLRFGDQLKGVTVTKATTPIKVYEQLRPSLLTACERNLIHSIFKGATLDLYPDTGASIPVYDRALFCGTAPARNAWYANINAGVQALNVGIAYNQNGLSVQVLRNLKKMAVGDWGGLAYPERAIAPTDIGSFNGSLTEDYILLTTPSAVESLENDPAWKDQMTRGVVVSPYQPQALRGSRYRGTMFGIHVFVMPELMKYSVTSGGVTAAWNLFCGAQAFGLVWSLKPEFKIREFDYDNIGMRSLEYRGQKALRYPSKLTPAEMAEHGLIHVFSRTNA